MTAETTRLRVRVSPGAGRAALVGRHGDAWKVRVTEAPERGRANEAVLRLLAEALAVPRSSVTLVSGHGGREKIVELTHTSDNPLAETATATPGREIDYTLGENSEEVLAQIDAALRRIDDG